MASGVHAEEGVSDPRQYRHFATPDLQAGGGSVDNLSAKPTGGSLDSGLDLVSSESHF